ncbi:MAG: AAA family ATPase [Paludibacteraceae bacterium]|nr:AAA family ATPase [Paludibacteraceae bacterium]
MISRLKVKGGIIMPFQDKEKGFQYPSDIDIEFTKGLNVIVGPNGCGKTTAITIMKTFMLVDMDGTCSSDRCHEICKFFHRSWYYSAKSDFEVYSDYTNKAFYMPNGLEIFRGAMSGGNTLTLAKAKSRHSQGESTDIVVHNMLDFARNLKGHFDFQNAYGQWLTFRENHYIDEQRVPDEGITTVLIDEPDAHLDVFKVKSLSDVLTKGGEGLQIITAIHNPLLICELARHKDVNFIEMKPGYVQKVHKAVKNMVR